MDNFNVLYKEIDKRLHSIDPLIRSKVLIQAQNELENIKSSNTELSEEQVIRNWIEGNNLNKKLLKLLKDHSIYEIPIPDHSIIKTLILSSTAIVLCFFLLIGLAFTFMSPVFEFNEKGISLLGGSFQISNKNFDISTNGQTFRISKNNNNIRKQGKIEVNNTENVKLSITRGHIVLNNSPSNELIWECVKAVEHSYDDQELILNPGEDNNCHIHLPQKLNYIVAIDMGLAQIHNPKYNLSLKMKQGQIQLKPDELITYKFDLKVLNGVAEVFDGQEKDYDYKIKINVNNGMISHSY